MPKSSGDREQVLFKIGDTVRERLKTLKAERSLDDLREAAEASQRQPFDFRALFDQATSPFPVIAEIKKASPSKGDIATHLDHLEVAEQYLHSGAAALSILTEESYFKGNIQYLRDVRQKFPEARLLMKDFFVDEYQLYQAREAGADAVLIIVALLGAEHSRQLLEKAKALGLSPLVEVHTAEELAIAGRIGADLIGINSRNLKDLSISLDRILALLPEVPANAVVIGESGITQHQDLVILKNAGCHGFLVGTRLMQTGKPGDALKTLLTSGGA